MAALRIVSYLPNPRVWKATIAARLCGVDVEVRGASPAELSHWLWDFDARPISDVPSDVLAKAASTGRIGFAQSRLYKTAAFLEAQPFGTVPAAFSPDGGTGIFESNSIMRAVARLGQERFPLYGRGAYESSRVDSFLDASLVFARDGQTYLLALRDGGISRDLYGRVQDSFHTYLSGIEQALTPDRSYLVGDNITLADICFVAEICLFHNERARRSKLAAGGYSLLLGDDFATQYPRSVSHFRKLLSHPAFLPDVGGYLEKIERSGCCWRSRCGCRSLLERHKRGEAMPVGTYEKDGAVGLVTIAKPPHNPRPDAARSSSAAEREALAMCHQFEHLP